MRKICFFDISEAFIVMYAIRNSFFFGFLLLFFTLSAVNVLLKGGLNKANSLVPNHLYF